jgi:hypothetical protein
VVGRTRTVLGLAALAAAVVVPGAAAAATSTTPMATWQANGRVDAIAVSGSTAYIGGEFTAMIAPDQSTTVARAHLAAINLTTGALLPWHPTANGTVLALRATSRTVFVGGAFDTVNGVRRWRIAALTTSSGGLVHGFSASASAAVDALAVDGSTVYMGGAFTKVDTAVRSRLAAINAESGALVASWHPSANQLVRALTVDAPSGVVYAGGDFTTIDGVGTPYLTAISSAGTRLAFADHPSAHVLGLAVGGGDVYAGIGGTGGQLEAFGQTSGTAAWDRWADGDVQAVSYESGSLFAGGHFVNVCQTSQGGGTPWVCTQPIPRAKLFSVDATNGQLTAWGPTADSEWGVFAVHAGQTAVAIGGDFTHVDSTHHWHYAQFSQ